MSSTVTGPPGGEITGEPETPATVEVEQECRESFRWRSFGHKCSGFIVLFPLLNRVYFYSPERGYFLVNVFCFYTNLYNHISYLKKIESMVLLKRMLTPKK